MECGVHGKRIWEFGVLSDSSRVQIRFGILRGEARRLVAGN